MNSDHDRDKSVSRVAVLGNIASGKSSLTKRIAHQLGLPEYHLDKIFWGADWSHIPRTDFIAKQIEIIKEHSWVIDGTFSEYGLRERFVAADKVIFLNLPTRLCLQNALARRGDLRDDLPNGADDAKMPITKSLSLLFDILSFRLRVPYMVYHLSRNYPGKLIVINSWAEEDEVLRKICRS